jgi:hypothetical protein
MAATIFRFSDVCCFCATPVAVDPHGAWNDRTDGDGCDNPTGAHAVARYQRRQFDAPEFYPEGLVAVVEIEGTIRTVLSEGERRLEVATGPGAATDLSDYTEFRAHFPNGVLPLEGASGYEWLRNGWFAVYEDGEPIGDAYDSLTNALAAAERDIDDEEDEDGLSDADILREIGMDDEADVLDEALNGTF